MYNNFLSKVFMYMCIGLIITFATGFLIYNNEYLLTKIFTTNLYWFLLIAEVVIGLILSARIYKLKTTTATILYFAYAILTGASFSVLFLAYNLDSIIFVFLATAIVFGIFAMIGKNTKVDLRGLGTYLIMGIVAVIILEIINMFVLNHTLDIVTCIIAIVIFMAYIAYDTQMVVRIGNSVNVPMESLALIGAFSLYLDFLNLFLRLLELFGKEK